MIVDVEERAKGRGLGGSEFIQGVGLGLRREIARDLLSHTAIQPMFVEFAPENWLGIGGYWGRICRQVRDRYPILCHGLSLSLGSPEPLDWDFLRQIKGFLDEVDAKIYSEHLSYSKCDNAHLYDLLPMPFREEAIYHVANRIRQVQEYLGRRIAIENVSYYTSVAPEMDEATFLIRVLEEADCDLLLDVNNVFVNAHNHGYDAKSFIDKLPLERVVYVHMAGHKQTSEDLIIDTHGEPIADPVYELLAWTLPRLKPVPILLERDVNLPDYVELMSEVEHLQRIADCSWRTAHVG